MSEFVFINLIIHADVQNGMHDHDAPYSHGGQLIN